ncbi:MAG: PadR family transcriptional regulator [Alphaproteobacteria bacterium]|nr:PadR family transcriptional regulator [Alphaproteobacteria bacterium]MDE2110280.1 PadR family transcriptional regulator [Alphaproteobacteria bacterium]MDE2494819.1 PadR family transcriptional regulator [Alphaproteobacteria bacterium]
MKRPVRITHSLVSLLDALSGAPAQWWHGYDLSKETGLKAGTLYPLLSRLESMGLLEARWSAPQANGRPPRHLYRLTSDGRVFVRDLIATSGAVRAT